MEYGRIPGIDKPVSRVAQGIVPIGGMEPDDGMAMLDAVYEMGCNLIDTSSIYGGGKCDRILGRWVRERGLTVPQIALAYVLNLPANVFPLVGCDTPEQFAANAAAVDVALSPEEMAYLDLRSDTR